MKFNLKTKSKYTINKSIRFPEDVVTSIEKELVGTNVSFSGFVIQACQYALNNKKQVKKMQNKHLN